MIKKWRIIYRVNSLLIMILASCTNGTNTSEEVNTAKLSYPYHVDLIEGMKNRVEEFRLSDIADSIRFIPLETTKECIIGSIKSIEMDSTEIFVHSSSGQKSSYYFRFNATGEFLNTIGKIGRGPGEYMLSTFSLDIEKKKVIIFRWNSNQDFIEFNYDGSYYGKCNYPRQSEGIFHFAALSGSKILVQDFGNLVKTIYIYENTLHSDLKIYKLYDSTGMLIHSIPHPINYQPLREGENYESGLSFNSDISFFNGSARMSAQNHDTAYMVSGDSILPAFTFHRGNLNPGYNERFIPLQDRKSGKYLSSTFHFYETNKFMYRQYLLNSTDESYMFRYNKQTGVVECQGGFTSGFLDDLSGGPNVMPWRPSNKTDNVWYRIVQARDFIKNYGNAAQPSENINLRFVNNRIDVANKISEEDNPVIILIYLKNEVISSESKKPKR